MKKIKVFHLINNYLPQTSNWIYHLVKALPSNFENHIGAIHFEKTNFYDPSFLYATNYFDGLRVLNNALEKRSVSNVFKKIIIRAVQLVLGNEVNQMIDYGRQNEIDVVHAHFGHVGWHFRKVAKSLKVPFVVSFYGYDYEQIPHRHKRYKKRYRTLFEEADLFLAEGVHGKKTLMAMGCPESKIQILKLGVEVNTIPFYSRKKVPGQLSLVQVASFTEKKGQLNTVEAFFQALEDCPELTLTLVGAGKNAKYREAVIQTIASKGLAEKIELIESISFDELSQFLQRFQVFIHPSRYTADRDCEGGAPIVLLDAQATGLPVISTNHCDIPMEVIHGQTGLLTKEGDNQALAESIKYFYHMSQEQYDDYSKTARNHVAENYDIRQNAVQLGMFYKQLLNNYFYK